jgi:hypothetical protein
MSIIQKKVSRHDTLRVQLANRIWDTTGSAFFEEDIPFSARNNQKFARKLVALYTQITQNLPDPEFLVVELGAGLGLLGHFFLTLLQEENPTLYAKTQFWSSDSGQLPTFRSLDSHKKCTKKDIDILHPQFEGKHPILCFGSYVLDSIPPICLHIENHTLNEIQFETHVPDNASILDTSTTPPMAYDVTDVVQRGINTWPRHWFPHLADAFQEHAISVPGLPDTLPNDDKENLISFAKQCPHTGYFNAIPGLTSHLKQVLAQLHPAGQYLISDFGFSQDLTSEEGALASRYQIALFHALCFPLVRHVVSQLGGNARITNRSLDQTQECLISKRDTDFSSIFNTETPDDGLSQRLDALLMLDDKPFLEAYPLFKKSLSADDASDYVLCKLLASRLFKLGHLKEVLHWAGHMENTFDHLAPDAYLLTGWACQIQKDHQTAISCFKEVLKTCPHHSLAYGASAASAIAIGDFDNAKVWIQEALTWARGEGYWIHLVTQCTMWFRNKQHAELKETLLWVKGILAAEPDRIPARVKTQLAELVPLILK